MKNEKVWNKFNSAKITIKFFTLFFVYGQGYILLENSSLGNCSSDYYILFWCCRICETKQWNTNVQIDLYWFCRLRTLTQNTWQQTRYFNVGFDSEGLFFQILEKCFEFRKYEMHMSKEFFRLYYLSHVWDSNLV